MYNLKKKTIYNDNILFQFANINDYFLFCSLPNQRRVKRAKPNQVSNTSTRYFLQCKCCI